MLACVFWIQISVLSGNVGWDQRGALGGWCMTDYYHFFFLFFLLKYFCLVKIWTICFSLNSNLSDDLQFPFSLLLFNYYCIKLVSIKVGIISSYFEYNYNIKLNPSKKGCCQPTNPVVDLVTKVFVLQTDWPKWGNQMKDTFAAIPFTNRWW